jgi:hypothetical protein
MAKGVGGFKPPMLAPKMPKQAPLPKQQALPKALSVAAAKAPVAKVTKAAKLPKVFTSGPMKGLGKL